MDIGNKIQTLRKQSNLSQEELAEKMSVARQTISKWELGETSPDLIQAKKLSKMFSVSLDELAGNDVKEILLDKVSNTERLAGIIIKILKWFGRIIILFGIVSIVILIARSYFEVKENKIISDSYGLYCYFGNEKKYYEATVNRDNPSSIELNENAREILDKMKTDVTKYKSKESIIKDIKKYIISNNGKCN